MTNTVSRMTPGPRSTTRRSNAPRSTLLASSTRSRPTRLRLDLDVSDEASAIGNLPSEACVEVPCLVDGTGVHPCTVGDLPPELVSLIRTNVNVQQLAVEGDRDAVHRAVKLDPLTGTALTLEEAHEMAEELIEANEAFLTGTYVIQRRDDTL